MQHAECLHLDGTFRATPSLFSQVLWARKELSRKTDQNLVFEKMTSSFFETISILIEIPVPY